MKFRLVTATGLVSRDGWVVYDDSNNAFTDKDDWWSTTGPSPSPAPPSPNRNCSGAVQSNTDCSSCSNTDGTPEGGYDEADEAACCAKCVSISSCVAWVFDPAGKHCWPLAQSAGTKKASDRSYGTVGNPHTPPSQPVGPQFSMVASDLYGFFHGLNFKSALFVVPVTPSFSSQVSANIPTNEPTSHSIQCTVDT